MSQQDFEKKLEILKMKPKFCQNEYSAGCQPIDDGQKEEEAS